MRIECPSCLEISEAHLIRVAERTAIFSCLRCEAEVSARVELGAKIEPPDEEGAHCPKCESTVSQGRENCPGCGLAQDMFASFDLEGPAASPELDAAWQRVEEAWEEDSAHEEFAAEIALSGNYRLAARRYRLAATKKARTDKAQAMLDRIQSMATAALLSTKPKVAEEQQPYKGVVILLMVMVILGAGVGILLMTRDVAKSKQYSPTIHTPNPSGRR